MLCFLSLFIFSMQVLVHLWYGLDASQHLWCTLLLPAEVNIDERRPEGILGLLLYDVSFLWDGVKHLCCESLLFFPSPYLTLPFYFANSSSLCMLDCIWGMDWMHYLFLCAFLLSAKVKHQWKEVLFGVLYFPCFLEIEWSIHVMLWSEIWRNCSSSSRSSHSKLLSITSEVSI